MRQDLINQNDAVTVDVPGTKFGFVSVVTDSAAAATANIVVEIDIYANGNWIAMGLKGMGDPTTNVASLTGASQAAWAEVPPCKRLRARRTDANAGDCYVGLEYVEQM